MNASAGRRGKAGATNQVHDNAGGGKGCVRGGLRVEIFISTEMHANGLNHAGWDMRCMPARQFSDAMDE